MPGFGKEIRDLRVAKGFTQKDLAAAVQEKGLRCEFTYLSKIENDRLELPPSEELLRAIADILGGDAESWLAEAGQFSRKALQSLVEEVPAAGVLLRKLQNKELSREQIERMLKDSDDSTNSESSS